jgi:NAD(P)-dependent dehydrogenase (short-subunit alcohol dehydrogenase family)
MSGWTLADRHAVVTGASGGLGRALCNELLAAGARVSGLDIDREALHRMQEADGSGRLMTASLDITDAGGCKRAFVDLRAKHGPFDLLINNAGITHFSTVAATAASTISQVMAVNFLGAVHCTQAALPDLRTRRGQVVVMSSVAGFAPLYGRCAYSASKHALHGYFETLRCETLEEGLNVLLVCPSFIATQRDHPDATSPYAGAARPGAARSTVGEVMQTEDAAHAIMEAIRRRRRELLLGRVAKQSHWARRLWPGLYEKIMIRGARGEVSREAPP